MAQKLKTHLIASAASKKSIEELVNDNFCSDGNWKVNDDLTAYNTLTGKTLGNDFRIILKKGRYRFELIMGEQ